MANYTSHNKGRTLPPEPLTKTEVLALMKVCSKVAPTGIRDRSLICTLWRGQLRISEALDLKPADFDPKSSTLRVLRGKGKKSRVVVIDQQCADVLMQWLIVRQNLGINGHSPIFCTLKGTRMNPACVREMLIRRGKKAGIEKRTNAHNLRHTGCSEMLQEGFNIREIQEQLGHENLQTTQKYAHILNPTERIEHLRARTW